jgi:hypothetical protein
VNVAKAEAVVEVTAEVALEGHVADEVAHVVVVVEAASAVVSVSLIPSFDDYQAERIRVSISYNQQYSPVGRACIPPQNPYFFNFFFVTI